MALEIPYRRDITLEYGIAEPVTPLIRRVVARNASPFTFKGTGTYIVGHGQVAVIDPGPLLPDHVAALTDALRGETVTHIVVTHTHVDHSPAAAPLKAATGAKTYGFGPHGSGRAEESADLLPHVEGTPRIEEGGDRDFVPDVTMREGDTIAGPGWRLTALHTPGHTSNHLCFALPEEKTLFTGDHVMGWSTTVVGPPDGSMASYRESLGKLLKRDDAVYWPTHGPSIPDPKPLVKAYLAHREEREAAILAAITQGEETVPGIVARVYLGLDPRLVPAAGRSALAHLVELVARGTLESDTPPGLKSRYRMKR